MGVGLFLPGQHHADGQGEGGQIHDDGDDHVGDVFVISRQVGQLLAHDVQHGHEDAGKHHGDGVVQCQQGHGDAVEAHGGQGLIGGPIELRVAGQPVQRSAGAGQRTGDGHGQHDVALVPDTGIAGGVAVGAAGLQLIAQGGLVHQDVHGDGDDDGNENAAVDLGAGEDGVQPQLGGGHAVEGGLIDVAGLGALGEVLEAADVEHPGHQVGGDPVGHDARQHLVDVQQGLYQAGDRAPQSAGQAPGQEGQHPDDAHGHGLGGDGQGHHQGDHGGDQILTGGADVEQAGLEGHGHGKSRHDQGRCPEQHVAQVHGVEAPGQGTGGVPAGAENTGKDDADTVPRAGQRDLLIAHAHDEHGDAAHQQTRQNGDQG